MRNISNYTKNYKNNSFEDYKIKYRRQEILKQIEKYKPKSILEIGIGEQPLFKFVENIDFTIIEPSDEFICNAKNQKNSSNVKIIKGFFEDIVEKNKLHERFDMIVCASLLHEVENPECMLESINKISDCNTIVIINVPNAYSLHRLIGIEAGIIKDIHNLSDNGILFQQHKVFDKKILSGMLEAAGFDICEEGTFFIKPFSHTQMWDCLQSGIIDIGIIDALYKIGNKYLKDYGSELYIICKKKE